VGNKRSFKELWREKKKKNPWDEARKKPMEKPQKDMQIRGALMKKKNVKEGEKSTHEKKPVRKRALKKRDGRRETRLVRCLKKPVKKGSNLEGDLLKQGK